MKKSELKEILKPIIKKYVKESIKAIIFEDGVLSQIIREVVAANSATAAPMVTEQKREAEYISHKTGESRTKLQEEQKKMLDSIGRNSFNGVNLFEGTTPIPKEGIDNGDPGMDISGLMKMIGKK